MQQEHSAEQAVDGLLSLLRDALADPDSFEAALVCASSALAQTEPFALHFGVLRDRVPW